MREIRFRAWNPNTNEMYSWDDVREIIYCFGWNSLIDRGDVLIQYTGLKDKNGREIYEGDVVLNREPFRDYEEHYGENIPFGRHIERLTPEIKTSILTVENFGTEDFTLLYVTLKWDKKSIIDAFDSNNFNWDDQESSDLQYLLSEYNIQNEKELITHLGVEVIGNIYENPELLGKENF